VRNERAGRRPRRCTQQATPPAPSVRAGCRHPAHGIAGAVCGGACAGGARGRIASPVVGAQASQSHLRGWIRARRTVRLFTRAPAARGSTWSANEPSPASRAAATRTLRGDCAWTVAEACAEACWKEKESKLKLNIKQNQRPATENHFEFENPSRAS
jgi:hypothetical protein